MIIGVAKETYPSERRVALVPAVVPSLVKAGMTVIVQAGAGESAGFADGDYAAKGARIVADRSAVFREANTLCQVRTLSANPQAGRADVPLMRSDQTMIGLADPYGDLAAIEGLAATGVCAFALELMPRITRAQSMDVLSSQATIAGYKAVLLAASHLPRMFPMMMTAAGTIAAAKAFIIGAGVAGLQAIASARRLGAVVQAYDVRPVVKEQVESLGAKFVQIELSSAHSEGQGGYAKAMDEEFYRRQRELMGATVAQSDIVITTAAVPGAKAPVLITADMVRAMPRGSVIVDLAAKTGSQGGNCELTKPDETIFAEPNNVTILGPTNLPATVPYTASQMYAKNMANFLLHLSKQTPAAEGKADEIIAGTLLCEGGTIVNPQVKRRIPSATAQSAVESSATMR